MHAGFANNGEGRTRYATLRKLDTFQPRDGLLEHETGVLRSTRKARKIDSLCIRAPSVGGHYTVLLPVSLHIPDTP